MQAAAGLHSLQTSANSLYAYSFLLTCCSGWWFEALWKIWKSIGMIRNPIYGKIENVPNHQPVTCCWYMSNFNADSFSRALRAPSFQSPWWRIALYLPLPSGRWDLGKTMPFTPSPKSPWIDVVYHGVNCSQMAGLWPLLLFPCHRKIVVFWGWNCSHRHKMA